MTVTATSLIGADVRPAAADRGSGLWGLGQLLAASGESVSVSTAWATEVEGSGRRERRRGGVSRPGRTVRLPLLGLSRADLAELSWWLARTTEAGWLVPLVCDQVGLSEAVSGGATLEAVERWGPSRLGPVVAPGNLPAGYGTYDGLPIVVPSVDWERGVEWGWSRAGSVEGLGHGTLPALDLLTGGVSGRPAWRSGLTGRWLTRSGVWAWKRLFDSRGGRLHPFWWVEPSLGFEAVGFGVGGSSVKVSAWGSVARDWDWVPAVAVELWDGTVWVRRVASVVRTTGVDELVFDASLGVAPALGLVKRVAAACLARFGSDVLTERWVHSEEATASVSVVERVDEGDVAVADLSVLGAEGCEVSSEPVSCGNCGWTTASTATLSGYVLSYDPGGSLGQESMDALDAAIAMGPTPTLEFVEISGGAALFRTIQGAGGWSAIMLCDSKIWTVSIVNSTGNGVLTPTLALGGCSGIGGAPVNDGGGDITMTGVMNIATNTP